jgi:hypothetical protein
MTQTALRAFAERVKTGNLGQDVQVIYRVAGGMPSERLEYEVVVDSVNGAQVTALDAFISRASARASLPAEHLEVPALFEQVSAGLHSLLSREKATYPPDALIGSLTIRVGSDEQTSYFVPEEEKRRGPGKQVAPRMDQALRQFWSMASRVAETQKDARTAEGYEGE